MEGSSPPPSSEELLREIADLKRRVETLEQAQSQVSVARQRTSPVAAPPASPTAPLSQGQPSALESRIGAQLFNRVGVFAVLAGAAWFLKLAIDRAWIGPAPRILIGLLVAIGLIVWSEHFRRTGARSFSFTLKALGSGIAYLALWACFSLHHLLPAAPVFIAMVGVTVVNAVLAWRQNSELLAALALAGGLATPALLANGADQEMFLLAYLLLLDIGAITLTALRPWPSLTIGAFAGTAVYFALGSPQYFADAATALTGSYLLLFFAAFAAAPFLARRGQQGQQSADPFPGVLRYFPVAVALATFFAGFFLAANIDTVNGPALLAVAMAAVYLITVLMTSKIAATSDRYRSAALLDVHLPLAIGLFALAGLSKFHTHANGVALSWLAELGLVATAASYLDRPPFARVLRGSANALLILAFCVLLRINTDWHLEGQPQPFSNPGFAVSLTGLAAFALVAFFGLRAVRATGLQLALRPLTFSSWPFLITTAIIALNLTALLSVSLQIELWWRTQLPSVSTGASSLEPFAYHHPAAIDFAQSAWFMAYGAALMAIGFRCRSAFLRWQALVLLTFSIGKVFLLDTSHLHEGYRVASFLGLGVLLLTVSFAYQRDWLSLRETGNS
jgi:hypothetical protein